MWLKLYLCHYGNWVQITSSGLEAGEGWEVLGDVSFCLISVLMVDRVEVGVISETAELGRGHQS